MQSRRHRTRQQQRRESARGWISSRATVTIKTYARPLDTDWIMLDGRAFFVAGDTPGGFPMASSKTRCTTIMTSAMSRSFQTATPSALHSTLPDRSHARAANTHSPAHVATLAESYLAGATVYELADRFGIHRTTASAHLHRHGATMRRRGLDGHGLDQACDSTSKDGRQPGSAPNSASTVALYGPL